MKHRIALLLTLTVAIGTALTTAGEGTAARNVAPQTLTVLMLDFHFKLSKPTLKAGKVTITAINKGNSIHNFAIQGAKASPFLAPGGRKTFTITLKKGKYNYVCTVPRHSELGMFGTLVVK